MVLLSQILYPDPWNVVTRIPISQEFRNHQMIFTSREGLGLNDSIVKIDNFSFVNQAM